MLTWWCGELPGQLALCRLDGQFISCIVIPAVSVGSPVPTRSAVFRYLTPYNKSYFIDCIHKKAGIFTVSHTHTHTQSVGYPYVNTPRNTWFLYLALPLYPLSLSLSLTQW